MEKASVISKLTNLHPKIVELLIHRGINSLEDIELFINPKINIFTNLIDIPPVQRVIELILEATSSEKNVIIYADADMDGISSAAIIYKTLSLLSKKIETIITEKVYRSYGVNLNLVENKVTNETLLIFLDVGTSDIDTLEQFKEKTQCEIVVIDHHEKLDKEVKNIVLLNPKCLNFGMLEYSTAATLSAIIAIGLISRIRKFEHNTLPLEIMELATLGIIADLGRLLGINRVIVKLGLKSLGNPVNKGLQYLLKSEIKLFSDIGTRTVAFKIVPLLNASCRMGYPHNSFWFLIEEAADKIKGYAEILSQFNKERAQKEQEIINCFCEDRKNYILLYSTDWHPGVISSVATRLAMEKQKPTIVMTKIDDTWRGSCRFPNGNMLDILKELSPLLVKYGGHKEACGFEVENAKFPQFIKKLDKSLKSLEFRVNTIEAEIEIELQDIDNFFLESLRKLEPFGIGNPAPVFKIKEANIYSIDETSEKITIYLYNNGKIFKGEAHKKAIHKLGSSQKLSDIVCKIYYTTFNENFIENQVSLEIIDFK